MIYVADDAGNRDERWYVMAVHPADQPGRRQRMLRAVDAAGITMATASFDGVDGDDRAEVTVDIAMGTETDLVAQLVRRLTDVANDVGVTELSIELDCRRSVVAEVLVRSGLAWRLRSTGGATRAELNLAAPRTEARFDASHHPSMGVTARGYAAETRASNANGMRGSGGGGRRRGALRWHGAGYWASTTSVVG